MDFNTLKQYGAIGLITAGSLFSDAFIGERGCDFEKGYDFVNKQTSSSVEYDLVAPTATFHDCYKFVKNNQKLSVLLKDYKEFFDSLCPETGDINGTGWIDKEPNPDEYETNGNGIPDALGELKLIEYVLKNPGFSLPNGLTHELVRNAWIHNDRKLKEDIGRNYTLFKNTINGLPQVLNALMILGDGSIGEMDGDYVSWNGSVGFVQGVLFSLKKNIDNNRINPKEYVRLAQFFAPDGDANGNGISNRTTLELSNGNLDEFVANALNSDFIPEGYERNETEQNTIENLFQIEREIYFVKPGENLEIKVSQKNPSNKLIQIPYVINSENASPNEDYLPENGVLRFGPGEKEKTIEFRALENPINQGSKNCVLEIEDINLTGRGIIFENPSAEIFIKAGEERKPFFSCLRR